MTSKKILSGIVLNKQFSLSLTEVCQACSCEDNWIIDLVDQGILEPLPHHDDLRFSGDSMSRAYTARRLQRDLGVNVAGIALALDLLDELELLRRNNRSQPILKE